MLRGGSLLAAGTLFERLARLGSVAITNARADGRGLYRVRVGPFASNGEAQRVLARVIGEGFAGSQVVYD